MIQVIEMSTETACWCADGCTKCIRKLDDRFEAGRTGEDLVRTAELKAAVSEGASLAVRSRKNDHLGPARSIADLGNLRGVMQNRAKTRHAAAAVRAARPAIFDVNLLHEHKKRLSQLC